MFLKVLSSPVILTTLDFSNFSKPSAKCRKKNSLKLKLIIGSGTSLINRTAYDGSINNNVNSFLNSCL